MSVYGNLSRPQRALLDWLLQEGAVSPAKRVRTASRAVGRLFELGFIEGEAGYWSPTSYVNLTAAGLALLRSRDFSHLGGSRQRARSS